MKTFLEIDDIQKASTRVAELCVIAGLLSDIETMARINSVLEEYKSLYQTREDNEDILIERYRHLKYLLGNVTKEVEEHFFKLAREAVEKKDLCAVQDIMRRCPDHVTTVFIADLVQHTKFSPPVE